MSILMIDIRNNANLQNLLEKIERQKTSGELLEFNARFVVAQGLSHILDPGRFPLITECEGIRPFLIYSGPVKLDYSGADFRVKTYTLIRHGETGLTYQFAALKGAEWDFVESDPNKFMHQQTFGVSFLRFPILSAGVPDFPYSEARFYPLLGE